jgi:DNA helicase HerA-like ATPase
MPPLLPPHQLTRHAVCLGMTGSGKTSLCIGILEDLARAGVPVLAIDPKGDLANLALTLDPTPEAYAGWVPDPDATAAAWQAGLAASGLAPSDVAAYREAVEVTVLTPGSESGAPVDVI